MKNVVKYLVAILISFNALADTEAVMSSKLIQLGLKSEQASYLADQLAGQGQYFGTNSLIFENSTFSVVSNDSDGADNAYACLSGGGACNITRSGYVIVNGNEVPSVGGNVEIATGNNASDQILFFQNNSNVGIIDSAGLTLPQTGDTLVIQEATPSTACMGVSTPNGTTNVTVTTSCATTGARVFYSRVGAVTNMASISTTTNPNGTSFTFASTGASDTLASSVVWFIIKEAA